jgi:hypothetical protein
MTTSSFISALAASLLWISSVKFAIAAFLLCVMHFGRGLFWNDKWNRAFVEGRVVRVSRFGDTFAANVWVTNFPFDRVLNRGGIPGWFDKSAFTCRNRILRALQP